MTHPLLKFVSSVCVQTAVYWGNPTSDGYGGYSYDTAVEIDCRWDEKIELIRASNGEEVISRAQLLVTQDIDEGGIVYLGSLTDLTAGEIADPGTVVSGAWKVISMAKNPLFKSTDEFVRVVYV